VVSQKLLPVISHSTATVCSNHHAKASAAHRLSSNAPYGSKAPPGEKPPNRTLAALDASQKSGSRKFGSCHIAEPIDPMKRRSRKSHASRLVGSEVVRSFVGNCIRSVCQACPNIILSEPWIGIQDICRSRSLGKLTQEQFDWNACVANYRLAEHHPMDRFGFDSSCRLYTAIVSETGRAAIAEAVQSDRIGNRSREGSPSGRV
jgi:hypothetical protein